MRENIAVLCVEQVNSSIVEIACKPVSILGTHAYPHVFASSLSVSCVTVC